MNILSLSGYIPEQICDTTRFSNYQGKMRISHYCGYLADYISQVLEDNRFDGAAFPRSCDSSRTANVYLQKSGKFVYQLPIPSANMVQSTEYLAHNIKIYKDSVERYYCKALTDIKERAEFINSRNSQIAQLYQEVCASGGYAGYLSQIHKILQTPLFQQKIENVSQQKRNTYKRIFLVGSYLCDIHVVEEIENTGLMIAGDNLTESKRLFSAPPVELKGDIYHEIANSILNNRLSPTQNNFLDIIKNDLDEIKKQNIDGVVFVTQKFCEPYDYLYTVYQKAVSECGIPTLRLIGNHTSDYPKVKLLIEAFADRI